MKTHIDTLRVFVSVFGIVFFVCSGCSDDTPVAPVATDTGSDRVITTRGVGDYQIGQSTLEEILGTDTSELRKRFTDAGLNFEFNQGKELTGVTVTSSDYSLENGLSVGSTSSEVRNKLGEPLKTSIELEPKGIQLDALVYNEYTFLLDQSNKVTAIRVGR
jgi:hypothetical protein